MKLVITIESPPATESRAAPRKEPAQTLPEPGSPLSPSERACAEAISRRPDLVDWIAKVKRHEDRLIRENEALKEAGHAPAPVKAGGPAEVVTPPGAVAGDIDEVLSDYAIEEAFSDYSEALGIPKHLYDREKAMEFLGRRRKAKKR